MNWKKETVELKKRRSLAKQQGGDKAIDLQHAKGRLTLRERIDLLLDKGSFQEQGEIAGGSETNEKGEIESLTPANFILGFGKISGKQVVVGGEDFTVKGGSPNSAGLRKSVYTEELALKYKVPLIRLHEGGGGSVAGPGKKGKGYGGDPVFSKSRFKSVADTLREIPVASAALGPVAGMPAARFVASHFRVMTKETAQILVAGPAVVERAFGKKMTKEELGGSQIHKLNGVTDNVAESEEDAFNQIAKFLSFFPQNIYELSSKIECADPYDREEETLLSIIPKERQKSYEIGIDQNIRKNISLSATYFDTKIYDLITYTGWTTGTQSGAKYDNIQEASSNGLELSTLISLPNNLKTKLWYTHLKTNVEKNGNYGGDANWPDGKDLLRRPRKSGGFTVSKSGEAYNISLDGSYMGGRWDYQSSNIRLWNKPFWNFDVYAEHSLDAFSNHYNLKPFIKIKNIFDDERQEILNFESPGRTTMVGIRGEI